MTYVEPLLSIFLLFCIVGWFGLRERRKSKWILGIGILGLILLAWPPAAWLLSRPLEAPYPIRPFRSVERPQAIVVLAAGISPPQYERPYPRPDMDTVDHCAMAAWVFKQIGPLPILGCEGTLANSAFPSAMRELLRSRGVPDEWIWIENRSGNTHENATFGSEILKTRGIQRIVLVTDAQSMLRAAACFRKQAMEVIPAPTDFTEITFSYDDFLPNWDAVRRNERTLHETLALAWYSINGWI